MQVGDFSTNLVFKFIEKKKCFENKKSCSIKYITQYDFLLTKQALLTEISHLFSSLKLTKT